jgi:hypothetical protein
MKVGRGIMPSLKQCPLRPLSGGMLCARSSSDSTKLRFRAAVITAYDGRCAVSGLHRIALPILLRKAGRSFVVRRRDLVGIFAGMVVLDPASWCQLQRASLGKLLNF